MSDSIIKLILRKNYYFPSLINLILKKLIKYTDFKKIIVIYKITRLYRMSLNLKNFIKF